MSSITGASSGFGAETAPPVIPDLPARETASACLAVLAHHSHSFALAARLLPRGQREDMAALYAWCRRADDAIDLPGNELPANALCRLEGELASVYRGEPQRDLVLAAFQRVVFSRGIPSDYPRGLLRGLGMDVACVRYRTLEALLLYCFNVAGTVGLMSCHVLGVSDARALQRAAHLGIAMQLTNISRDVLEDWRRGRCYLPRVLPAVQAAPGAASQRPPAIDAIASAVARLLDVAERYYRSADLGVRALPWRASLAVRAARLFYAAIGDRILATRCDVLRGRIAISPARKLRLLARAVAGAVFDLPARWSSSGRPVALPTTRFFDVVRL